MTSELNLRLLGGLALTRNGTPLGPFLSQKVPALLAYLAITRRPHTREALAGLLWGGLPDVDARSNLRQALSNLRKLAEPHLLIQRDTVEFNPTPPYFLDVEVFTQKVRTASAADLQTAADLYAGEFLAGYTVREAPEFEEWVLVQRSHLRELALHGLQMLVQLHATHGHYAPAIEASTRLLALDPWREEAHRQLMVLQARTGQRSAALAQYEICRRVLEKELGVEPSVETMALYDRLRLAQQAARHNLPTDTTSFIGRTDELAELQRRLAHPTCRLLTLTGPGGVGKSRLAQQAATTHAEVLINGAWYVSLSAANTETLLYDLAEALHLTLKTGDPKKQLLNFLRPQELLLVLDNFEHLLAATPLLTDILRAAPDVKLLVTSRERLNLQSEWVFELAGLALSPKADADPAQYSAGQLFIHGVERQHTRVRFTKSDWVAVHTICRLLEGLPLGIELAAAQLSTLNCATIAAEIVRGLDFLATTQQDVPERQRSLHAVVASSWWHLTENEQAVFAQLAVFQGSFSAPAAEAVAGATPAHLANLTAKSLVRQSAGRYELHAVLRRFATEQNHQPEREKARHATYYAEWLANFYRGASEPNSEGTIMAVIATEFSNLRAAWQWASTQALSAELEQLRPGLYRFIELRGYYREGEALFAQAAAQLAETTPLVHKLIADQAMFLVQLGQMESAGVLLEKCLAFFQHANEPQHVILCLNGLCTAARSAGHYARAEHYVMEQLRVAREAGLRREEAGALNNLGILLDSQSRYVEAIHVYRECLALRRELGDRIGLASSLINLSVALTNSGEDAPTEALLTEALAISREFNDARRTAAVLTNLGAVAKRAGRLEDEKSYYQQALAVHRESGFRLGIALALNNLGSVTCRLGEWAEARRYLRASLNEANSSKFDFVALDALVSVALLRVKEGRSLNAIEVLALPLHHPAADGETVAAARELLAEISAGHTPASIAAALERGQTSTLADVVKVFLADN